MGAGAWWDFDEDEEDEDDEPVLGGPVCSCRWCGLLLELLAGHEPQRVLTLRTRCDRIRVTAEYADAVWLP